MLTLREEELDWLSGQIPDAERSPKGGRLLLIGALFGGLITWLSGCTNEAAHRASEKRDAANLLLAFAKAESRMDKPPIDILKESLQNGQIGGSSLNSRKFKMDT
jgi:hypothetical protein